MESTILNNEINALYNKHNETLTSSFDHPNIIINSSKMAVTLSPQQPQYNPNVYISNHPLESNFDSKSNNLNEFEFPTHLTSASPMNQPTSYISDANQPFEDKGYVDSSMIATGGNTHISSGPLYLNPNTPMTQEVPNYKSESSLSSRLIYSFPFFIDNTIDTSHLDPNDPTHNKSASPGTLDEKKKRKKHRHSTHFQRFQAKQDLQPDAYKSLFYDFFYVYDKSIAINASPEFEEPHINTSSSTTHTDNPLHTEDLTPHSLNTPLDPSYYNYNPNSITENFDSLIDTSYPEPNLIDTQTYPKTPDSETLYAQPPVKLAHITHTYLDGPNYCPVKLPLQCIPRSMASRLLTEQFPEARFIGACPFKRDGSYPTWRKDRPDTPLNSHTFLTSPIPLEYKKDAIQMDHFTALSEGTYTSRDDVENNHSEASDVYNSFDSETERSVDPTNSPLWSLRYTRMDGFIWEEIGRLHMFGEDSRKRSLWTFQFHKIGWSCWDFLRNEDTPISDHALFERITHYANKFVITPPLTPSNEFEFELMHTFKNTPNNGSFKPLPEQVVREIKCLLNECVLEHEKSEREARDKYNSLHDYNTPPDVYTQKIDTHLPTEGDEHNVNLGSYQPDYSTKEILRQIVEVFKDPNFVMAFAEAIDPNSGKNSRNFDSPYDNWVDWNHDHTHTSDPNKNSSDIMNYGYTSNVSSFEESLIQPWEVLKRSVAISDDIAQRNYTHSDLRQPTHIQPISDNKMFKTKRSKKSSPTEVDRKLITHTPDEIPHTNYTLDEVKSIIKDFMKKHQILNVQITQCVKVNQGTINKFLNGKLDHSTHNSVFEKLCVFVSKLSNTAQKSELLREMWAEYERANGNKKPSPITLLKKSKLAEDVVWVHSQDCENLEDAKRKVIGHAGYKYLHTGKTTNRYVRNYVCHRHKDCAARSRIIHENSTGKVWIEVLGLHTEPTDENSLLPTSTIYNNNTHKAHDILYQSNKHDGNNTHIQNNINDSDNQGLKSER